jgi:zona occludens toxin
MPGPSVGLPAAKPEKAPPATGAEYLASFVPLAPGHPESAPAYQEIRQVKSFPRVIGGACNARGCRCYTQQGRDAGLDNSQCKAWLDKPPFDPYQEDEGHSGGGVQAGAERRTGGGTVGA